MDLHELRNIAQQAQALQQPVRIRCCTVGGCYSSGGPAVKVALEEAIAQAQLTEQVEVKGVGCLGLCSRGPLVQVDLGQVDLGQVDLEQVNSAGQLYEKVTPEQAPALLRELLPASANAVQPREHLLKAEPSRGNADAAEQGHSVLPAPCSAQPGQHPFFTQQLKIVLGNSGQIDPTCIEDYIVAQGYTALNHALLEMTPNSVVETITRSGLQGRGGAGYPTGLKWATVAKMPPGQKYVVCNADEGDPGAFMDRSVLESDPHRVLEGMAIAAYAIGANQGYIYVRGEYPLAIEHLQIAIQQARRRGLLGSQIFDSSFNFRIDLRIGAGAFVCGEETALMASIEGKRGIPRPRPPYPAESGLWGCPTLINNVETFANIAPIIRNGADWFGAIGTEKSKGTKVFSLAGQVCNTGLIEVPMGISLQTIVEEMGGGIPQGQAKAVQTGGPSGGCIPAANLDTSVDYDSFKQLGSIMGSGGMIVMDQDTNMVDVACYFMQFCMEESCGKCIPCRTGTVQLYQLLNKIREGLGTAQDLAQLEQLCNLVQVTSLCGLGQSAPNPVLSTLRYFRYEYEALLEASQSY